MGVIADRVYAEYKKLADRIVIEARALAIQDMGPIVIARMEQALEDAATNYYMGYRQKKYDRALDMYNVGIFSFSAEEEYFYYDWDASMPGTPKPRPSKNSNFSPEANFNYSFGDGQHGGVMATSPAPFDYFVSEFEKFIKNDGTEQFNELINKYFFEIWNREVK